ncbi:MAG TPA: acetyl-CoA hydrolase/transferase C-terminal domain-containing protein [Ramlibacter sp.]|nr:acetyl-CoA hydrolase/transferase C-terminal domain-containing protein [Ramlibacter sp.]
MTDLAGLLAALPAGEGIAVHSGAAHPTRLAGALADAAPDLRGRRVYTLLPCGPVPYAEAAAREALELSTFLPGPGLRRAMDAGRVLPLARALSAVPAAVASGEFRIGAVLLRVSPPDEAGRVSLGVAVDYMPAAIAAARVVIAEIDPRMPRTCGDCSLAAARIDAYVESIDGPHSTSVSAPDPADEAIAEHLASLVEDGAVLQLGVGALPERVLARLAHRKHLGLHTGIIGDGARALIERGVIDNSTKGVLPGVSVATMLLGSAGLYAFADRNPAIEMHPCSFTHDAGVLRGLGAFTAINSALQFDLEGRANAETVGSRRISLPGGLPDFARAAASSPRGHSIIAVRACDKAGRSSIVPRLRDAEASLLPNEVDFFVTEYGIAAVRGASAAQRRKALLAIAHPAHREALAAH